MQPDAPPSGPVRLYLDLEAPLTDADVPGFSPHGAPGAVSLDVSPAYAHGRVDIDHDLGATLGWVVDIEADSRRYSVYNAGTIMVGLQATALGVTSRGDICLGAGGKLWKMAGKLLHADVVTGRPGPSSTLEERAVWADRVARAVVETLVGHRESKVTGELGRRYRLLVETHVERLILKSARYGYKVTSKSLARAVSKRWGSRDLLKPRHPHLAHAMYTSLVLGLEAKDAADLIVLGALGEFKVPFVTREVALAMYHQAVVLLGRMYPEWHLLGGRTDWTREGWTLERLFRGQYARVLNSAWDRELPVEVIAGVVEVQYMRAAQWRSGEVEDGS